MGRLALATSAIALVGAVSLGGCALIAGLDFEDAPGSGGAGGMGTGGSGAMGGNGGGAPLPEPVFLVALGGEGDDVGVGVTASSNGDLVVTGDFVGELSIESTPTRELVSLGAASAFVARLSTSDGLGVWARQIDSTTNVAMTGVEEANDGALMIAGDFVTDVTFPSSPTLDVTYPNNVRQVFQVVGDAAGALSDVYATDNAGNDLTRDLAVPSSGGGWYVAGTFKNVLQLDEQGEPLQTTPTSDQDAFVAFRSSSGVIQWVASVAGAGGAAQEIRAVSSLGSELVVGGWILEPSQVVSGTSSVAIDHTGSQARAFYAVLNGENGFPGPAASFGGTGQQKLLDIAKVNASELIAVGTFKDTIELPSANTPTTLSAGGDAGFVIRMSREGIVSWSALLANLTLPASARLSVACDGETVVVAGRYEGSDVAIGSIPLPPADATDGFVAALRAVDGEPLWAFALGGAGIDEVSQVIIDQGHVVAIGTFATNVRMGTKQIDSGAVNGQDAFVVKFPLPESP